MNNLLTILENCLNEIKMWVLCNILKLDDDKTEFIVFSTENSVITFLGTFFPTIEAGSR